MPFYFDTVRTTTTNGTTLNLSTHLLALTAANKRHSSIRGLYGNARFGTAGGASLRLVTAATIGSGGTSQTPKPRQPSAPAADLVLTNDATTITPGGTPTLRLSVGIAQAGGHGGWVALEPDAGVTLLSAAAPGANGNAEVNSLAVGVSVPIDITLEHSEQ